MRQDLQVDAGLVHLPEAQRADVFEALGDAAAGVLPQLGVLVMLFQCDDVGFGRHCRPPLASWRGIARQVDEFEDGAVGVVEIGARAVDDAALAVLFEGDRDAVLAKMVERRLVLVVCDGKGVVHAAMVLGVRVDRRVALDEDQADAGGMRNAIVPPATVARCRQPTISV